jgi:hypothetical protein
MRQGIEKLVSDGREVDYANAPVVRFRMRLPAIDGNFVPAFHEADAQLLRKGLISAVTCRYPACSK